MGFSLSQMRRGSDQLLTELPFLERIWYCREPKRSIFGSLAMLWIIFRGRLTGMGFFQPAPTTSILISKVTHWFFTSEEK